jgi:thioredoxin reductase
VPANELSTEFDTAIVGGGPAGLSAAIVLGRSCRRVILFDHGQPRNYAAEGVHCFLGHDGIAPLELRNIGRKEAEKYGVKIIDAKVVTARGDCSKDDETIDFEIEIEGQTFSSRTMLLATGVRDELPDIPQFKDFYGRSVHHCPYCDGWEHRDERLVAFGKGNIAAKLALELRTWSLQVIACSNGEPLAEDDRRTLTQLNIDCREEKVAQLVGDDGRLRRIEFDAGPPLECDALFFSTGQGQRSCLVESLGCERDEDDLVKKEGKQHTCVDGLFIAGDADCDVQFAVVAAAEGAVAAAAIKNYLQKDDVRRALVARQVRSSKRTESGWPLF